MFRSIPRVRGFSTLEMMLAFAILAIVLVGVLLAHFGVQYWTLTSQTANEGLAQARAQLEDLRAAAQDNFLSAIATSSDACVPGLCYHLTTQVTDISPCSKYGTATASWQVQSYPVTSVVLSTMFTSTSTAVALGGDCSLAKPVDGWKGLQLKSQFSLAANPTGIDVLNGIAYVTEDAPPYFETVAASGVINPCLPGQCNDPLMAIDVARDLATGSTYAYTAASSTQFNIMDVTDPVHPVQIASTTLAGTSGFVSQGRAIAYYNHKVYITTDQQNAGNVLHIFDVTDPTKPNEVGNASLAVLNTTVSSISVRTQYVNGIGHRYAYLAVGNNNVKELMVLDVTNPTAVTQAAYCTFTGSYQGFVLSLLGNTLYFGRNQAPKGTPDLFAFDATNPGTLCSQVGQAPSIDVDTGSSDTASRHPSMVRASGAYLFIATNNTTPANGEIQVRSTANLSLIGKYLVPGGPAITGMDWDGDAGMLYASTAKGATYQLLELISS